MITVDVLRDVFGLDYTRCSDRFAKSMQDKFEKVLGFVRLRVSFPNRHHGTSYVATFFVVQKLCVDIIVRGLSTHEHKIFDNSPKGLIIQMGRQARVKAYLIFIRTISHIYNTNSAARNTEDTRGRGEEEKDGSDC